MDRKEFEIMAERLRPRILGMALRMLNDDDAEDVAQDALLRMWGMGQRLDSYRSIDAVGMAIARNLCIDRLRSSPAGINVGLEAAEAVHTPVSPEYAMINDETEREVDALLASLPEGQQVILRMKHIEGMETHEIAQMLNSNDAAVRVTLSRARNNIKKLFLNRNKIDI